MFLEYFLPNDDALEAGNIQKCNDSAWNEATINGVDIKFISPVYTDDTKTIDIVCKEYTEESEWYYSVVAGILFQEYDILVDRIELGSRVINRATIWKKIDTFLQDLMMKDQSSLEFDKIITDISEQDDITLLEAVIQFAEENESIMDNEDICGVISDTMLQKLEADAVAVGIIKSKKKSNSLFSL